MKRGMKGAKRVGTLSVVKAALYAFGYLCECALPEPKDLWIPKIDCLQSNIPCFRFNFFIGRQCHLHGMRIFTN